MENASKALIIAGAILISILLISIGIILINSGKDVVETGTAGMSSQKIQTFNSQFTAYEGTRKGSEIKNLTNLINASNAADEIHQVNLYVTFGSELSNISNFLDSESYIVEIHYASSNEPSFPSGGRTVSIAGPDAENRSTEAGYIDYIYIK